MKIFIWEGKGISAAYHDDGTLVVLANTAAEARAIVRQAVRDRQFIMKEWSKKRDELIARIGRANWTSHPEGKKLMAEGYPDAEDVFDGEQSALDREPDKVLEIDTPRLIAFNGGGYD